MTGQEHYREAERLLSQAEYLDDHGRPSVSDIAAAQVHATLAAAAATRDFLDACNGDYPPRIAVSA